MNPPYLKQNDEIRIVSPSGAIDPVYINRAKHVLESWGYNVTEGKYAREKYGRYAGTPEQRLEDLQTALNDPHVKAILCGRGGYGLIQIIDKIDFTAYKKYPKWIIGFSDITVIHSAISHTGISSVHGIMAKHLTELSENDKAVFYLKEILSGNLPAYLVSAHPLNIQSKVQGKIIGGNLSVLAGLRGTDFDYDYKNKILFIEDVGEEEYCIDRMMQNLRLSGILSQIKGLIVGHFNEEGENPAINEKVYKAIYHLIKELEIPVCFDFPAGHVNNNMPLIIGAEVDFQVNHDFITLTYI